MTHGRALENSCKLLLVELLLLDPCKPGGHSAAWRRNADLKKRVAWRVRGSFERVNGGTTTIALQRSHATSNHPANRSGRKLSEGLQWRLALCATVEAQQEPAGRVRIVPLVNPQLRAPVAATDLHETQKPISCIWPFTSFRAAVELINLCTTLALVGLTPSGCTSTHVLLSLEANGCDLHMLRLHSAAGLSPLGL